MASGHSGFFFWAYLKFYVFPFCHGMWVWRQQHPCSDAWSNEWTIIKTVWRWRNWNPVTSTAALHLWRIFYVRVWTRDGSHTSVSKHGPTEMTRVWLNMLDVGTQTCGDYTSFRQCTDDTDDTDPSEAAPWMDALYSGPHGGSVEPVLPRVSASAVDQCRSEERCHGCAGGAQFLLTRMLVDDFSAEQNGGKTTADVKLRDTSWYQGDPPLLMLPARLSWRLPASGPIQWVCLHFHLCRAPDCPTLSTTFTVTLVWEGAHLDTDHSICFSRRTSSSRSWP